MSDLQKRASLINPANNSRRGRTTKYRDEYAKIAFGLVVLDKGITLKQLAYIFGVSQSNIKDWLRNNPEFSNAVNEGRKQSDAKVVSKLYERACGYEHKETKVFQNNGEIVTHDVVKHYPPDVKAALAWLQVRQPDTFAALNPNSAPNSVNNNTQVNLVTVVDDLKQSGLGRRFLKAIQENAQEANTEIEHQPQPQTIPDKNAQESPSQEGEAERSESIVVEIE